MPIHYDCPHCGHKLAIPEKFAGRKGQCKKCSGVITVPKPMADSRPKLLKPILYAAAAVAVPLAGLAILIQVYFAGQRYLTNGEAQPLSSVDIDLSSLGAPTDNL